MGEQVIDDTREFVGGGHDGRFRPEAGPHPSVVGSQAVVAATDRLCCEPKGLTGTIAGLERAPAQDLASRDLVVESQPQPGTEGLRIGPISAVAVTPPGSTVSPVTSTPS